MSNGEVCCILGVCCPPESVRPTLISELEKVSGWTDDGNAKVADFLLDRFDFAPKGTVQPLIDAIAAMAKAHG